MKKDIEEVPVKEKKKLQRFTVADAVTLSLVSESIDDQLPDVLARLHGAIKSVAPRQKFLRLNCDDMSKALCAATVAVLEDEGFQIKVSDGEKHEQAANRCWFEIQWGD